MEKRGMKRIDRRAAVRGAGITVVAVALVLAMGGLVLSQIVEAFEAKWRLQCMNNVRQIGFAMVQFGADHDDAYPGALDSQNEEKEPVQYRFAKLLKLNYLNTSKVFVCPSAIKGGAVGAGAGFTEMKEEEIAKQFLGEMGCWYGVDPKANHAVRAARAIVADRPDRRYWGYGVSSPEAGKPGSNSENHGGAGQNVLYNDGHVRWAATCKDDAGIDPNIYGVNKDVKEEDDSNIDFGVATEKKEK